MTNRALALVGGLKDVRTGANVTFEVARESMVALFEALNKDDPSYLYDLAIEHAQPDLSKYVTDRLVMSQYMAESLDGPFMVFNVFEKYNSAVEDRPMQGTIRVDANADSKVVDAIENFRIYGEQLVLPEEHTLVTSTDPFSSGTEEFRARVFIGDNVPAGIVEGNHRLIVESESGDTLATLVVRNVEVSVGLSGQGMRVLFASMSRALKVEYRSKFSDSSKTQGSTQVAVSFTFADQIAAEVIDEIRFVYALWRGYQVGVAPMYGGRPVKVAILDDIEEPPAPEWLLQYVEALNRLQPFAEEPLRILPDLSTASLDAIEHTLSMGKLLEGGTISQRRERLTIHISGRDIDELIAVATPNIYFSSPMSTVISGVNVRIPVVYYSFRNVVVEKLENDQMLIRPSGDTQLEMSASLSPPE